MKIDAWLRLAGTALRQSGIDSARLDSLILLEDATGHDRAWLLAHPEAVLSAAQLDRLADNLERRLQHEPLAYIRGHAAFYGRQFNVTPAVLIPRPESEAMIELLKESAPHGSQLADIGTGSGALAITAVLETGAVAAAVDIDEACLAVAADNAVVHTAPLQLLHGNLLEPFLAKSSDFMPSVVLANLPYVPTDYVINEAAKHEPKLALYGGVDGLDLYRELFAQLADMVALPTLIITESLEHQHQALAALAADYDFSLAKTSDLAQAFIPSGNR